MCYTVPSGRGAQRILELLRSLDFEQTGLTLPRLANYFAPVWFHDPGLRGENLAMQGRAILQLIATGIEPDVELRLHAQLRQKLLTEQHLQALQVVQASPPPRAGGSTDLQPQQVMCTHPAPIERGILLTHALCLSRRHCKVQRQRVFLKERMQPWTCSSFCYRKSRLRQCYQG